MYTHTHTHTHTQLSSLPLMVNIDTLESADLFIGLCAQPVRSEQKSTARPSAFALQTASVVLEKFDWKSASCNEVCVYVRVVCNVSVCLCVSCAGSLCVFVNVSVSLC